MALIEYGYQIDVYVDGEPLFVECRDFGGNHRVKVMSRNLARLLKGNIVAAIEGTMKQFRETH